MKFLQKLVLCLAVLALAWPCASASADEPVFQRVIKKRTINCGYFSWPPYFSKDPNTGKFSGINYDIMEAIGRNLDLKINWALEVGIGEVGAALDANKFDIMCASVWPSPGRVRELTLTQPTFFSPAYAFVRADDKRFDGNLEKANAQTVKVTAIEGDYSYDLAREVLPSATIVSLPMSASGSEMLLQVVTKKADVVLCDESIIADFMKTNPNTFRKVGGIGAIRVFGELLPVRRGEYQLRDMLDIAITQLANDGVIDKILRKYEQKYNSKYYAPAPSYIGK